MEPPLIRPHIETSETPLGVFLFEPRASRDVASQIARCAIFKDRLKPCCQECNAKEGYRGRVEDDNDAEDLYEIFDLCSSPDAPGGYLMKIGPNSTRHLTPDECHWLELRSTQRETEDNESQVMILTAGIIAQRKFDPDSVQQHHDEGDRNRARPALSDLSTRRGISEEKVWSEMTARTEDLFDDPIVWKVVCAFAAALLKSKTLSGKQFLEIARCTVSPA